MNVFVLQSFCYLKYEDKDIQNYNFLAVVYECETWSITLREERMVRVLENMVLRRIFGPKRDEVTGEWKKTTYCGA